MANVCNAVWTRTRAKQGGYDVESTLCELCSEGEDSVHHRLWLCQHARVVELRNKVAPKAGQEGRGRAGRKGGRRR